MRIRQHIIVYLLFRRDEGCITYYFRRDEGCIIWFAQQLNDLVHRMKNIVSANVLMEALPKQQWETSHLREIVRVRAERYANPRSLSSHR